ncbi:MAG: NHL repeat-containing protein, partial [bacterium]
MAVKRRRKTTAPRARRARGGGSRGRGRRVALALAALLLLAIGGACLYILNRAPAEIPIPATVAQVIGGPHRAAAGAMNSPRGLAIAPDGDLYVADLGNSRIAVFGPDGGFKFGFGVKGAAGGLDKPGEFNEPSGVAVGPDGSVYVADTWNGRIQKFSPKGRPEAEFGGSRYSFYSPRSVAVDSNGDIYVGDTGNSEVKILDPTGRLLKTLGGNGGGSG